MFRHFHISIIVLGLLVGTFLHCPAMTSSSPQSSRPRTKMVIDSLLSQLSNASFADKIIPITTSIIRMGKRIDYRDAVCKAYSVRCKYLLSNSYQTDEMKAETKAMMDYAKSIHSKRVYYEGWSYLLQFYTRTIQYEKAFIEIAKFKQAATHDNLPDYVAMTYRYLGNLFYFEGDFFSAIKNYYSFVDFGWNKIKDDTMIRYYYTCGMGYFYMEDYATAANFIQKGDEFWGKKRNAPFYGDAQLGLAYCYFFLNRYNEMDAIYNKFKNSTSLTYFQNRLLLSVKLFHHIANKEYEQVDSFIKKNSLNTDNLMALSVMYQQLGKEKEEAETQLRLLQSNLFVFPTDRSTFDIQRRMLYDMMKTNNDSLELQKKFSVLKIQKNLFKTSAEREAMHKEALKNKLEADALQTHYIHAQQQSNIQKEQHKLLSLERDAQRKSYLITSIFMICSLVVIAMLVCYLSIYLYSRRKYLRSLKKEDNDIVKLEHIDEKLNLIAQRAMHEAEDADRLKDQFIEHISHAVRTSLNVIVGFSSMLTSEDLKDDEAERQKLKMLIEQNSTQLSAVVNSVLDLTNIQKGKYKILYNPTTVEELINTALHNESARMQPGIELHTDISNDCQNIIIYTDVHRVTQSLRCLLDNAFKFVQSGPVDVTCSRCSINEVEMIRFTVTDIGPIIPSIKANDIFEPFIKLDDFSPGYGLGLSFCREISRRLKGQCYLDTEYTIGTRFVYLIPLLTEEPVKEGGEA